MGVDAAIQTIPSRVSEQLASAVGDATSAAIAARNAAQVAATTTQQSTRYFPTRAAGEAGSTTGQLFSTRTNGLLTFYEKTAIGSVEANPAVLAGYATKTGAETLANKTLSGATSMFTSGGRIGITDDVNPLSNPQGLVNIVNKGSVTLGLRVTSYWTGTTAAPYQNNDNSLWETFNSVTSDSANRSWSGSFPNAYNNIPAGVTDSGERTGVIGWAVSVSSPGYNHAGRLARQLGVHGVAGFQGTGSAPSAVIDEANGVHGYIYADSPGATIREARAGYFISSIVPNTGVVERNYAVYAGAGGGTIANYSFYGNGGRLFNLDKALFGTEATQSNAAVVARVASNSFEFGNPDPSGYGSNIGATSASGYPFLAFCAEASTGDSFRTRGKRGVVILSDLSGSLIFGRLPNLNAPSQSILEDGRFDQDGRLVLAERPIIPNKPPSSASDTGKPGETTWDDNYLYVCIAANTWKRTALSTW